MCKLTEAAQPRGLAGFWQRICWHMNLTVQFAVQFRSLSIYLECTAFWRTAAVPVMLSGGCFAPPVACRRSPLLAACMHTDRVHSAGSYLLLTQQHVLYWCRACLFPRAGALNGALAPAGAWRFPWPPPHPFSATGSASAASPVASSLDSKEPSSCVTSST